MVAGPHTRAPWSSGDLFRAAVLAAWIGLCDLWLKVLARTGACEDAGGFAEWLTHPLDLPASCSAVPLLGASVTLLPANRDGGPFGLLGSVFGSAGQIWALALLALAATITILVVRWRYRDRGDAMALGALWAGAAVLAAAPLLGSGTGLAEITIAGVPTGVGDLALLWALAWLTWRAIAEARA